MHAINAVLQRPEFDSTSFAVLIEKYKKEFPDQCDPKQWDAIHSSQEHVMSYALAESGYTTYYIGPYQHRDGLCMIQSTSVGDVVDDGAHAAVMVVKPSHVLTFRQATDGVWWNLDSQLPRPRVSDLAREFKRECNGFLFVWGRSRASKALTCLRSTTMERLRPILAKEDIKSVKRVDISNAFIRLMNGGAIIADIELPFVLFMRYYEFVYETEPEFHAPTRAFHVWYDKFCMSPGDRMNTLHFVPDLLFWMLQYNEQHNPNPVLAELAQNK